MLYGLLSFLFLSSFSLAKTEIVLKSLVETSPHVQLMFEDIIETPKVIPTELLEITFIQKTGTLTKPEILEWFKEAKLRNRELGHFSFLIPATLEIRESKTGLASRIRNRLLNRLQMRCADCDFQVKLTNVPTTIKSNFRVDYRQLPLSGPFMINMYSPEGDKSSWISGQIQAARKIVKTARFMRAGDRINETDLIKEYADISFLRDYFVNTEDLVGKKLSRAVAMKNSVTSQDIERDIDVRQGQTVKAKSGSPNFEVVIQAVALDSGAVGDVIRIRNPHYQKMLSARILEAGIVEIQ